METMVASALSLSASPVDMSLPSREKGLMLIAFVQTADGVHTRHAHLREP